MDPSLRTPLAVRQEEGSPRTQKQPRARSTLTAGPTGSARPKTAPARRDGSGVRAARVRVRRLARGGQEPGRPRDPGRWGLAFWGATAECGSGRSGCGDELDCFYLAGVPASSQGLTQGWGRGGALETERVRTDARGGGARCPSNGHAGARSPVGPWFRAQGGRVSDGCAGA